MHGYEQARSRLPVRILGAVLVSLGCSVSVGGAYLLSLGGSPYYVACGVVLVVSGAFAWQQKAEAILAYALLLLATTAWGIWEAGYDGWALMPRIIAPVVLGFIFLLPMIRRGLLPRRPSWSTTQAIGATVAAVALGSVLHAFAPPDSLLDPLYQAGTAAASLAIDIPVRADDSDWPNYGNQLTATRFSPLTQITPENVNKLQQVWTFRTGMKPAELEVTPLKIDRTVYACTSANDVIALDAETGAQIWRTNANANYHVPNPHCRGLGYYHAENITGSCAQRIITATVDARIIALDATTGVRCPDFGANGEISLLVGMGPVERGYYYVTSAPTIVDGKIIVGGNVSDNQMVGEPSGVIRAFDAITGKLAWAWDMGAPDRIGEPAADDQYTRATPNSWGTMSADETLGLVYVPLGNPTPDYYGALRRTFDERYGTSLVALDVKTGRPRWHFQVVHHDLWDYDVSQQPSLVDIPTTGGVVPAVVLPTKRAETFVLNRATGQPIYPVEEQQVPQKGAAPDEHLSPTQPFSVGLPSLRGPDLLERSMWGITPIDQLYCRIKFKQARYEGTLTPPGLTPSIQYPGYAGGVGWGGATVDISRNIAFINTIHVPNYVRLVTRAEADVRGLKPMTAETAHLGGANEGLHGPQEGTPYGVLTGPFMSPLDIPCNQPPFGRLTAVDLTTGKLIWSKPFGTGRDTGPWGIPSMLPFTIGVPNMGGGVATRSGLYFIGATQDAYLRAYDSVTGELLWKARLPTGGNATPLSYISPESGRQFVVIAAGGSGAAGAKSADYIVAYALPKAADK